MGRNGETPIFDAITPPKINIDTKMAIFFKGATFSSQPIILAIQPLVFGGVFGVIQHETTIFQVDVWGRDVKWKNVRFWQASWKPHVCLSLKNPADTVDGSEIPNNHLGWC